VRYRVGILVLALAAALSACSDDSDDSDGSPSDQPSEITIECDEFEDTAAAIAQAQSDLYAGTGGTAEAIDTLVVELEALKEGAPADVQTALTDMIAGFRDAEELLEDPSPKNQSKLAELAPKLAEDSQTITEYVTSECDD
jgi:thymidine phosphorylase